VWRYFLENESELPTTCPHCDGETRHRCPECAAPFPSAFAVECEECGAAIRPPEVLGVRIRKPKVELGGPLDHASVEIWRQRPNG
jgi:hypothetical protein